MTKAREAPTQAERACYHLRHEQAGFSVAPRPNGTTRRWNETWRKCLAMSVFRLLTAKTADAGRKGGWREPRSKTPSLADRRRHPHRADLRARFSILRSRHAGIRMRHGSVVQRIDDPDPERANRQALEDAAQGAIGLALASEGAARNAFGYGPPAARETLDTVLAGTPSPTTASISA